MPAAGYGTVQFDRVGGRTALVRGRATSPLRLFCPQRNGQSAWLVSSTLGGGLLGGEAIHLDVSTGEDCSAVLGTQASTKIHCSLERQSARQHLQARVGADSLLIVAPDPVACFADAIYEQRQRFDLSPSASLVVVDWITSGRWACGERWAMTSCRLRTDIFVGQRQVFRDAIRLEGDLPARMGRFNCWGSLVLIGQRLASAVDGILERVAHEPLPVNADVIYSAGPIPGGMMLRIAAISSEHVLHFFRECLMPVARMIGDDPWSRKG